MFPDSLKSAQTTIHEYNFCKKHKCGTRVPLLNKSTTSQQKKATTKLGHNWKKKKKRPLRKNTTTKQQSNNAKLRHKNTPTKPKRENEAIAQQLPNTQHYQPKGSTKQHNVFVDCSICKGYPWISTDIHEYRSLRNKEPFAMFMFGVHKHCAIHPTVRHFG